MILRLTRDDGTIAVHGLDGGYDLLELSDDINQAIDMGGEVSVLLDNNEILPFDPAKYRKVSVLDA